MTKLLTLVALFVSLCSLLIPSITSASSLGNDKYHKTSHLNNDQLPNSQNTTRKNITNWLINISKNNAISGIPTNSTNSKVLTDMFALQLSDIESNSNVFGCNKSSSDNCKPGKYGSSQQCNYVKECCSNTVSSGIAGLNYLNFIYCTMSGDLKWPGLIILFIVLLYAFVVLANIADDYFAPIMGEIADTLGVSHNVAGVTFLALGNGAPDISSSIAAIKHGGNQTLLGIGALLGAAVFDPIAVSAVIATVCENPKVARRPLLRDCCFLSIAAGCVLYITQDGKVTILEATSMWIIYLVYVLIVVIGEAYKKWAKQKKRKKRRLKRQQKALKKQTVVDRIMPKMKVFSNESMRDVFAGAKQFSPMSGTPEDDDLEEANITNSEANISVDQSTPELYSRDSPGNLSTAQITHGAPQLLHKLEEIEAEQRALDHGRNRASSIASTVGSSDESMESLSDESDDFENRPLYVKILWYILTAPSLIVQLLCILTIPMTDKKNWNDKYSVLCCLTAPVFSLYSFSLTSITIKFGSYNMPIYYFVLAISVLPCLLTIYMIYRKYKNHRKTDKIDRLIRNNQDASLQSSANKQKGKKNNKNKAEIPIEKQCVLKVYFLFLGFIAAVGWIEIVANELVNLLTTLGVISTINLDILGLTVLAWGNSIGDMIADVSVSKRGYSKMGIGAAIGGPTLNVLIGVGLGFAIKTISSSSGQVAVPTNSNVFVSCIGVLGGMLAYITIVPLTGWRLRKWFGYICYIYYGAFLITNVLVFVL